MKNDVHVAVAAFAGFVVTRAGVETKRLLYNNNNEYVTTRP